MVLPIYDTIQRSHYVNRRVMQGDKRCDYWFRFAKFYCGIVTADAINCNLLCAYCWNYSRNLNPDRFGEFFSPSEVAGKLLRLSESRDCHQFRISGAEPILGEASTLHLAEVIRRVDDNFIIETNGVMLGLDPQLVDILESLPNIHVRLCIKALWRHGFQKDHRCQV